MRLTIWRRGMQIVTAAVVLALVALQPARGADWPQWRGGPQRDAVSADTGLLKQWPQGGPPLAWKANGIGEGMGGVAVAAGHIYTSGDSGDSSWIFALNESDGTLVWKSKVGRGGSYGGAGHSYAGPRGVPTVDGERLYLLSQFGELVCFTTDGKEVWRADLVKDFGGGLPDWAYSESPLVDGEKVLCTPGGGKGTLLALDKNTGKALWQSKEWTEAAGYSSPIVATIGGVRQYIQHNPKTVAGIAADDGRVLWKASPSNPSLAIATPIEKDGLVYVTSGYGTGCHLFKVIPPAAGGSFSVEKVYSNRNMSNHHGGVILLGDYVYGSHDPGLLTCMDLVTGKVAWKNRSIGKGSIAIADGRLYLRSEKPPGQVALVEVTPDGYKELGSFTPPDGSGKPTWPHPVIANGRLYLRDQDSLLCYDIKAK
jgi:outer membrane protein assembly factor BamB